MEAGVSTALKLDLGSNEKVRAPEAHRKGCRNSAGVRKPHGPSRAATIELPIGVDSRRYCGASGGKTFLRASLSTTATKSLMRGSFFPFT